LLPKDFSEARTIHALKHGLQFTKTKKGPFAALLLLGLRANPKKAGLTGDHRIKNEHKK